MLQANLETQICKIMEILIVSELSFELNLFANVNLNPHLCTYGNQVKDCLDHSTLPMDGATLTEALHQRGINVRYLGTVLEFVEKTPAKAQLEHFYVSPIPRLLKFSP